MQHKLEQVVATLARSEAVRRAIRTEFGPDRAVNMLTMMKRGQLEGDDGDDLDWFLRDLVYNEAETVRTGSVSGTLIDDEWPISVAGFGGVFFIFAAEFGDFCYFLDVDEAVEFAYSNWEGIDGL